MTSLRHRLAAWGAAALLGGCGGTAAPTFVTDAGDADAGADAGGGACRANADCDDRVACTRDLCLAGGACEHIPSDATCVTAPRCGRAEDCDDRVPCTRDSCLVDGACSHVAQNEMCAGGQTCDAARGCTSGVTPPATCRADADCRDAFDCTVDACGSDGRCVTTPQNARCTTAGQVCRAGMGCISERACSSDANCDDHMRCNGAERCVEFGCVAGAAPSCDDANACTVDACAEAGDAMCTHAMNPSCTGSMPRSGVYTLNPGAMYTCSSILGKAVVNFNITVVMFSIDATGITVTGGPTAMRGGPVTGGMFSATGSIAGDCVETYSIAGRFTDDRHFTGTYQAQYAGPGCFLTNCMNRSFPVMGTLAM